MADFIPQTDAGALAYGANYSAIVTADPVVLGLSTTIATNLASKQALYASCLEASTNPATRGGSTIFAKDQAKKSLIAYLRLITRTVQGTPTVTDQQKYDLGITVRKTTVTPIGGITEAPKLEIVEVIGRTVRVKLSVVGPGSDSRARPANAAGAVCLSYVGDVPPPSKAGWTSEGVVSKTVFDVEFPVTVMPGTKVYLSAYWYTAKALASPACTPVSTYIQYGGLVMTDVADAA